MFGMTVVDGCRTQGCVAGPRCGPGAVCLLSLCCCRVGRAGGDAGRELPAVQQQAVHVPFPDNRLTKPDKASVTGCN